MPGEDRPTQEGAQRFRPHQEAHDQGQHNSQEAGQNQRLQRILRGQRDTGHVVGLFRAGEDARTLTELAADLLDHIEGVVRHGEHQQRAEERGRRRAQEDAGDDPRIEQADGHDDRAGDVHLKHRA
jgi:hypothetical protein